MLRATWIGTDLCTSSLTWVTWRTRTLLPWRKPRRKNISSASQATPCKLVAVCRGVQQAKATPGAVVDDTPVCVARLRRRSMMNNKQLQAMHQKFKEEQATEGHAHDFTAARPDQRRRPKPPPKPTGTNVSFNVATDGPEFTLASSASESNGGSTDGSSDDGSGGEAAVAASASQSPTKQGSKGRRRRRRGSKSGGSRSSPTKRGRRGRRRSSITITVREGCGAGMDTSAMQAAGAAIASQFQDMNCSQRGDVSALRGSIPPPRTP